MNIKTIYSIKIPTQHGECFILATDKGVCWIGIPGQSLDDCLLKISRHLPECIVDNDIKPEHLKNAADQLKHYFDGEKVQFSFALDLHGTAFQKLVWHVLQTIPYGKICTYKDVACAINHPQAARAVGAALGANPIAIALPCHRVIGSNKKLTGYAGGLHIKKWLLTLEGIQI